MTEKEMKNKISMELQDPITQQGFEIICNRLAKLEEELKEAIAEKEYYQEIVEDVDAYQSENEKVGRENNELVAENKNAKDLIRRIIHVTWGEGWNYSLGLKVEAEQFLKEK